MPEKLTSFDFDPEIDLELHNGIWGVDATHSIPPWTPMFGWFWTNYCSLGAEWALAKLSLPGNRSWDMRYKEGLGYYGWGVVYDEEEYTRREAKFREVIRPFLAGERNGLDELIPEMVSHYERLKQCDVDRVSDDDLFDHFEDCIRVNERMWKLHHFYMELYYAVYLFFENTCKELLGIDDAHPLFHQLLAGFDNKLFQIDRRLWQLSKRAAELGLEDIFLKNADKEVVSKLESEDREEARRWLSEFRQFLSEDGWRTGLRAEFIVPTWIEEPSPAISTIKMYLGKGGEFDLDEQRASAAKEREAAEREVLPKLSEEQRGAFVQLLRCAQVAGVYSESHNYYCEDYCYGLTRRCLMAIGRRYMKAGVLDKEEDILFLVPDEIRKTYWAKECFTNLRKIVERRRKEWEGWTEKAIKGEFPPFILAPGKTEQDIMPHLIRSGDGILLKTVIGSLPVPRPELKADLQGVCGSPGVAKGRAVVCFTVADLPQIKKGDILVAPTTAPSWTPVFSLIGGAVVDRGGSLSHSAIVGREYGIPVVINTFQGSAKIKTGDYIQIDANRGVVYIERKAGER